MLRKVVIFLALGFLALAIALPASAQEENQPNIPERNGDYPDPEHPGIRVRVFVHEPKNTGAETALTCTDPGSEAVVDPAKWRLPQGIWTYNLNSSSVPVSVGAGNLATMADLGFVGQWQPTTNGQVTFQRGADTTKNKNALDYQNIIAWGRTSGSALAVTYIRYNTSTRLVVDVDTIMNLKFPWSWNVCGNSAYDAQAVLTHEQGHWLGLNDEYDGKFFNNTMYGYGAKGDLKADTLTNGDILGAKALY